MVEYLYKLAKDGLTLQHKTYSITTEDDDFEKWENNLLEKALGT